MVINLNNKKEVAISFLKLSSSGKIREAYKKYIHPHFYHHNPYFKGDREALLKGMEESSSKFPGKTFEVIRALEEGDLVALQCKVKLKSDISEIAVMYFFRFENDFIIEEWEVSQEVPKESPNKNGIF